MFSNLFHANLNNYQVIVSVIRVSIAFDYKIYQSEPGVPKTLLQNTYAFQFKLLFLLLVGCVINFFQVSCDLGYAFSSSTPYQNKNQLY